ncbi:spore coat protein [candidate division WOR-1 bacterium RIFOXYB2_FULL_42_35]|uniref:Glucose-1-phosphate thymidylyltransferase n=1 Tax=candidate division WOR-1 bacterium RIFOXYC2_FULL_41_25 TaxID=1802586 RepID=A0A1F4TKU9_UNCSA|nr:MAG: spore coat protein [candidate division WOR-1 bacterium RIFOXYA2_FULL_41_14]OGC22499.1 MAG: spore coat protein [candidate division WOR-1 bacterium RIFOXYB2_FULL_42_35]OGC33237.1 MAG: spore coat protein [candidate division WOR-1 bacterium RIFOXYC2_FULL_41_25]OGC42771.1 MAG: spore coat protein [candidate division WOR-1 bacterium RIFOXYD2_FULL_41_8]
MNKEKKLKGIILAGGTGSRLFPLTKVTNKHLLPVARKPMIFHPIEKLVEIGVKDILIVTGVDHLGDIVSLLGSGKDFGCHFTYKVQDEAGGIAQALALAENFIGHDLMAVILGDNIFEDNLKPFAEAFANQAKGARVLLKEVSDPQRFGVVELKGRKIISIEEKPKKPKSAFAVTGIYFYDHQVFKIIQGLKPSARGEFEISDVNRAYLKKKELFYDLLSGWWTDAGTFESLERASLLKEGKIQL